MPNGNENVVEQLILEEILQTIEKYGATGHTVGKIAQLAEENLNEDVHFIRVEENDTQGDPTWETTYPHGTSTNPNVSWSFTLPMVDFFDTARESMQEQESAHPAFNSSHEAYSFLREAMEDLWEMVRNQDLYTEGFIFKECVRLAALAGRLVFNLYPAYYKRPRYDLSYTTTVTEEVSHERDCRCT